MIDDLRRRNIPPDIIAEFKSMRDMISKLDSRNSELEERLAVYDKTIEHLIELAVEQAKHIEESEEREAALQECLDDAMDVIDAIRKKYGIGGLHHGKLWPPLSGAGEILCHMQMGTRGRAG